MFSDEELVRPLSEELPAEVSTFFILKFDTTVGYSFLLAQVAFSLA